MIILYTPLGIGYIGFVRWFVTPIHLLNCLSAQTTTDRKYQPNLTKSDTWSLFGPETIGILNIALIASLFYIYKQVHNKLPWVLITYGNFSSTVYFLLVGSMLPRPYTAQISSLNFDEEDILTLSESSACPIGYFHCNTTEQCVPQRFNCDGIADCDDASDEWDCDNYIDDLYWNHLFRKQPYGRYDEIPLGICGKYK